MIFYDIGLATESEVARFFGFTAKDLGLTSITVTMEEGRDLTAFLLSLEGMSAGQVASVRKLRCYQRVRIQWSQHRLQPERQIGKTQGADIFSDATKTHLDARPGAVKSGQR